MALTLKTNGSGSSNIISSTWFNDFTNLFTGAMNDQPVTFKYLPGAAGNVLQLIPNANSTPLVTYKSDGTTQAVTIDNAGNLNMLIGFISGALGAVAGTPFATKVATGIDGSTAVGIDAKGTSVVLNTDTSNIILSNNAYFDGAWKFATASGFAWQWFTDTSGNFNWRRSTVVSTGAGVAITWSTSFEMARFWTNGGGTPGQTLWEGTTDPAGAAVEGDIWIKA